jgi:hypothetical protein
VKIKVEEKIEAYMVGESVSGGVAARAASFSEAIGVERVKCDVNTAILSPVLLFFIYRKSAYSYKL